jgi:hypothetical protein
MKTDNDTQNGAPLVDTQYEAPLVDTPNKPSSGEPKAARVKVNTRMLESYEDKFRDLRMSYLNVLELGLRRQELDMLEAFTQFKRATLMDDASCFAYVTAIGTRALWADLKFLLKV